MTQYQNRGGEIWEWAGVNWHELFTQDAIARLEHYERKIVERERERDSYRSALRRALKALTDARDCGCEISLEDAIEDARQSWENAIGDSVG
ncbi:MAG: hypothetical protein H8M99_01535 [Gloeobacteraceae cyanobacterium ES-bin-144]|nr:hypothetical protein [Verrucomicrobiales bacterium]